MRWAGVSFCCVTSGRDEDSERHLDRLEAIYRQRFARISRHTAESRQILRLGTDVDAGDSFTYALVSGFGDADNAAFTIVGNELRADVAFDFETQNSYSIRVRTTESVGSSTAMSVSQ